MNEIKCPNCGEKFKLDGVGYADILKQVKDQQFEEELKQRLASDVNLAVEQTRNALNADINKIKESLAVAESQRVALENNKDKEIAALKAQIERSEIEKKLSLSETMNSFEKELDKLKQDLLSQEKEQQLTQEVHNKEVALLTAEIERQKEFKMRLSTKMIGESLEQYCLNEFNKLRSSAFKDAYFEKDNDAKGGSKGDFIFRDPAEGVELLSIMFEMKNENEESVKKQKNEIFYSKLDKDRNEKKCEYAVLVSTLEEDNDLFNQGIVDVSYRYPKMFVIRPQFFIPIITFLKNSAEKTAAVKNELAIIKNQNIDITTFEEDINDWKSGFLTSIKNAGKKHEEALEQIDKAIANLMKVRDSLTLSDKHLLAAENKMDDLTVKRLTRNNPTMKAKFNELDKNQENSE